MVARELVGSAVVADWIGLSDRRVRQLVDEGVLEAVEKGRTKKFDLQATVKRYIEHLREDTSGKLSEEIALEKLKADADFKRAKADEAMLALEEQKGSMHRSEDVEEVMGQMVYAVRSGLLSLPARCAIDAASAQNADEASEVIGREVNALLSELANYNYDQEEFKKLVRRRRGLVDDDG